MHAIDDDVDSDLIYVMTSVTIYDVDGRPLLVNADVNDVMHASCTNVLSWFCLNSTTGILYLASRDHLSTAVDRELCSSVIFQFIVQDRASMDDENKNSNQPATLQVQYHLLG